MKVVVGIDVGKQYLDVFIPPRVSKRIENNEKAIKALLGSFKPDEVKKVVCEPTGGYERLLVTLSLAANIPLHLAHPNKVRAFAKASGHEAKTDRIDAQVLSHYGEVFEDKAASLSNEDTLHLRGLLRCRNQLVRQKTQELNRLEKGLTGRVADSCHRHLAWLTEEIKALDKEYKGYLKKHTVLVKQAHLYQSIRGIGVLTAATLMADLPELGYESGKKLTALVGLAPWASDSGTQRGYRCIRGGRAAVRRALYMAALYMAALSAIRYPGQMRTFYQHLRKQGKKGKVAMVAVMRKLLLQVNAVAKRQTPWVENYT